MTESFSASDVSAIIARAATLADMTPAQLRAESRKGASRAFWSYLTDFTLSRGQLISRILEAELQEASGKA